MGIKLKTEEGAEFSFDTVAEFMEFKKQIDAEEALKETESAVEEDSSEDEAVTPKKESKFDIGDKIRVIDNESSGHVVGTIGEIVGMEYIGQEDRWSYVVHPTSEYMFEHSLRHRESDLELHDYETEIEVGDKVRIVSSDDGTDMPYHYHDVGSVGKVVSKQRYGRIEVEVDGETQYLLPHHYEKVKALGKDANGKDLYKGDVVTGTEDNDYGYTNSSVDMEVLGEGSSFIDEEANILVRILGKPGTYRVDSSKFIKLSDKLDEEEPKFKVGDKVRVVGNIAGHNVSKGIVREITDVDTEEPKYNLSEKSFGSWADTEDIEPVQNSTKFRTGDVVKVTESFEDNLGDRAICGAVYNYDESLALGETFVGTVLLGDNVDKLELVCRAQDRLDK